MYMGATALAIPTARPPTILQQLYVKKLSANPEPRADMKNSMAAKRNADLRPKRWEILPEIKEPIMQPIMTDETAHPVPAADRPK
jgi:hypothetical protein